MSAALFSVLSVLYAAKTGVCTGIAPLCVSKTTGTTSGAIALHASETAGSSSGIIPLYASETTGTIALYAADTGA